MRIARIIVYFFIGFVVLNSCKHHKKQPSLSGDEVVEVSDFMEFFKPVTLPFNYWDTSFQRKVSDSALISRKVFAQFAPDSLLIKIYGKSNPKIYAVGKAGISKGETYLLLKTVTSDKKVLLLLAFDKKQKYIAGMPVLKLDNNISTNQSFSIDRRFSITSSIQLRSKDGSYTEGKDVYILNGDSKSFTLIMTDPLMDNSEIVNPIDTLSRKHKWAADYTSGKTNLVSLRDAHRPDRLNFFIHFDKNNGECKGEIKGEAIIKSANSAEYHEEGDPCILKFIFSSTSVALEEVEGCGSKRSLNCSLDGSFARKKNPPPKKSANK